jgi:CRISPR-associated endonuclease/helicase Cas3
VKAIIEFIYKKTATQFYERIRERARYAGFRVLVLSGTILEPRRRRIIELIKSADVKKKRNQKILLISTQVVEAGVDIDMDIGFKDRSLIDSDEQLAGRVNRNARPNPATVYIFDFDRTYRVYGEDLRYRITQDHIELPEYQRILSEKAFDDLYDLVCDRINHENTDEFVRNFDDYKEKFKHLDFSRINWDFKLIDQQNVSVFVPLRIPARCFSSDALTCLRDLGYYGKERAVDGKKVWDAYLDIVHSKNHDFIKKRIDLKKIYGIMSQFMFSILTNSYLVNELLKFCSYEYFENYSILYLRDWQDVYDYQSGIREESLGQGAFL